jgi:hypothetical protein
MSLAWRYREMRSERLSRGGRFPVVFECPIVGIVDASVHQSVLQPRGTTVFEHIKIRSNLWEWTIIVSLLFLEVD